MGKPIFTDDPPEVGQTFQDALTRYREAAEREVPPLEWAVEEKATADARLAAMGKSGDPERDMAAVTVMVRELAVQSRIESVVARILNPDKAKGK